MSHFKTYNKFQDEIESLYLLGNFSDDITVPLIELSNKQNNDFTKISKRLSFLTAESFQNIVRHGHTENHHSDKIKYGMFSFTKTLDNIVLSTANHITNENSEKVDADLTELNSLTTEELKSKYIDVLTKKERTKNGGAGVGFISIIRKTKGKIDYRIYKINDKISNFLFQSNLQNSPDESDNYFRAKDHYDFMVENDYLLFRKGIFDHSSLLIMTDLLSVKIDLNTDRVQNKALFFTVGELVQNIYSHGYKGENGHEGIFSVKKEGHSFSLSSGNFILTKKIDEISKTFDTINSLNEEGIKQLLKKRLFEFPIITDNKISSGIGLLEIKKLTKTPINIEFDEIDEHLTYLTVTINNIKA